MTRTKYCDRMLTEPNSTKRAIKCNRKYFATSVMHWMILGVVVSTVSAACTSASDRQPVSRTSSAPTSADSAQNTTVARPAPLCALSTEFVRTTVAPVVGDGPVTTESTQDDSCGYRLNGGSKLVIWTYTYASNRKFTIGVYNTDRPYGGSNAQQVYSSAKTAYRDIAAADPAKSGFRDYPSIGAGTVTNNMGAFILAGTKEYWFTGQFVDTVGDPSFDELNVAIAKALADL